MSYDDLIFLKTLRLRLSFKIWTSSAHIFSFIVTASGELLKKFHLGACVSMCLFGPHMFTWINIKVKTNDTFNCLIRPGVIPFKLTVSLAVQMIGFYRNTRSYYSSNYISISNIWSLGPPYEDHLLVFFLYKIYNIQLIKLYSYSISSKKKVHYNAHKHLP